MNAIVAIDAATGLPVTWQPIATIPDQHRDGRDVLVWAGHLAVCSWCDGWRDSVGRLVHGVTDWADVEEPRR